MDPLTLGIGAIGLGMQLWGRSQASDAAERQAALEQRQAALEQQINNQKKQQMELNSRRAMLENFRNAQRMRAQGVQASVNQGAQYGTGMLGGLYQNTAQAAFNDTGLNQNLAIGRNIFGINNDISGVKMQMAEARTDMYDAQGWMSLGGQVLNNANTIRNVGSSLYSQANNAFSGSGGPGYSPSGIMRMFG